MFWILSMNCDDSGVRAWLSYGDEWEWFGTEPILLLIIFSANSRQIKWILPNTLFRLAK